MNLDEARERLLDLVYGELDGAAQEELLRLVRATPELEKELAKLRAARAALSNYRAAEPAMRQMDKRLGATPAPGATAVAPSPRPLPRRERGWLRRLSPVAVAATLLIGMILLLATWPPSKRLVAQATDFQRTEVSLTILSEPEEDRPAPVYRNKVYRDGLEPGTLLLGGQTASGWVESERSGLAVVRDQRVVRNLAKGVTEVRFRDVPEGILPDSVRLRSMDEPGGLTVLEQNYQYDLASTEKILHRYIDLPITILFTDGQRVEGELLSYSDSELVIRPKGQGPRNVSRKDIGALRLAPLAKPLLTRPTLVWTVDNRAALNQRLEVAYMTKGLSWRADYVLRLTPGAKPRVAAGESLGRPGLREVTVPNEAKPYASDANYQYPQVLDTAELVGYATVTNRSGARFENAQLKLLAGDVHLVREDVETRRQVEQLNEVEKGAGGGGFQEKSFFEYHLYTLGRPTTLADEETKQIELVSGGGIQLTRSYVYDRSVNPKAARVVSEFENSERNGLGRPLPKGVVRLYGPDGDGTLQYSGQTTIDHTPKDEKVRLPWGFAFDIACDAKQTLSRVQGRAGSQKWRYTLRSSKDYDVTVTVIVRVPRTATTADCTLAPKGEKHPWHVREVGLVEIDVPVKANAAATVDFSFDYDNVRGGGLKSPYDRQETTKKE